MSADAAREALDAADRLQKWLDDFQISARLGTPQYANPGELKSDLRLVLAALRKLPSRVEEVADAGTGRDSLVPRAERTKPETIGGSLSPDALIEALRALEKVQSEAEAAMWERDHTSPQPYGSSDHLVHRSVFMARHNRMVALAQAVIAALATARAGETT